VKEKYERYYLLFLPFVLLIQQHYHGSQHQLVEKPSVENKILHFTCQIVDLPRIVCLLLLLHVPTESGKMERVGDFVAIPFTELLPIIQRCRFSLGASIT
jgi:hypothetical protein